MKRTGHEPRRVSATLTVLALFAAFIGVFTPTASAQDDTKQDDAKASSVLIMDASSSMLESDGDGTRMDSAKKAAHALVDELPETATMGFVAYGANESDAPDNREAGCKDIETLAPVKALDRDKFHDGIDGLTPTGYTPMGNALRHAADELPDSGERSIILVSDGIDSCAPPPVCEVAEELADEGVGLVVHTVGFHVDEAARKELECISQSTGGEYRQADDADKLAEELQFLAQRGIAGYQKAGTEFEFADSIEDAKWLGEGLYHTRVTPNSDKDQGLKYIRVAVPEGHNAYVSVAGFPDRDATGDAGGTVQDRELYYRLDEVDSTSGHYSCTTNMVSVPSAGSTHLNAWRSPDPNVVRIEGDTDTECDMDQWYLGYDIYRNAPGADDASIEVQVSFEPIPDERTRESYPEGDTGRLGEEPSDLPMSDATPVTGGTGFADAVEVKPGAYSDTIVPGEYRFYKLPVDWGQRPVVTIRTGKSEREEVERIAGVIYSPHRARSADLEVSPPYDGGSDSGTATTDRPVLFNNREANAGGQKSSLAGDYYVGVAMYNRLAEDEITGIDQPYEIVFDVEGEKVDGPEWRMVNADGPPPSDTPPSAEKDKDAEKKDDEAGSGDTAQQAQESDDEGGFNLMWIAAAAGGILVIALIIIVALLLTRRR